MNRRIVENDREMMNERLQLRRMLLSEDHSFHASLYPEMDKEYLNKLKRRLVTANSEVITTLRQAMEEDANAISEDTIKQRERFEKALAEGDPFSTLRDNFRSSLDELLLMRSQFERDMARDLDKTFKDLGEGIDFAESPMLLSIDFRPRSSVWKTGMVLANCEGTIDEHYTGEVAAIFYDIMPDMPNYEVGDKIG